jgi:hypothetical protein
MSGSGVLRFLPEAARRRSSISDACCLRPQALRASPRLGFLPLRSVSAEAATFFLHPPFKFRCDRGHRITFTPRGSMAFTVPPKLMSAI